MINPWTSLRNLTFRRLYAAQTISLFGDALTWLGLALLAFEIAGPSSPTILAVALTLRVTAFVVFSPFAGVIADRFDRKPILLITHLGRMLLVCLLPFVREVWHIYALVLGLNIFNAFFTPTYQATIPLVTTKADYPQAIALSSITSQILGVFGPGLAGVLALIIGARDLFLGDGLTFLLAAILISSLNKNLRVEAPVSERKLGGQIWSDIQSGTNRLWGDAPIRYGLAIQLVAAIAGAQILVNTVGYVQGTLQQTAVQYGWVMMGFGLGATGGTVLLGVYPQYRSKVTTLLGGGLMIVIALLPANFVKLPVLIGLWMIAGFGQSLINLSMQTLIADRNPSNIQGRVYGAHFAWSHLWWAVAYPLAGWLGSSIPQQTFLGGGLIGIILLSVIYFVLKPDQFTHTHIAFWHDHYHSHDDKHHHDHQTVPQGSSADHQHLHCHSSVSHVHAYIDISHQHHS